jgi:hypothetical protein
LWIRVGPYPTHDLRVLGMRPTYDLQALGLIFDQVFAKLKLLRSYLRSTMSQKRLNDLSTYSTEKDTLKNVDLNIILIDFAFKNMLDRVIFKRY